MTSRLQHLVWNMFPVCNNLHRSSVGRGLAGTTSCSSTVPTKWMIAAKTPEVKSSARSECECHSHSQWTGPEGSSTCWSPWLKHQPQCHSVTQTNKACHYGSGQLRHPPSPPLHLIYHKQTLRVSSRFLSNTKSPAGKISSWVWVHVQRENYKMGFHSAQLHMVPLGELLKDLNVWMRAGKSISQSFYHRGRFTERWCNEL